MKISLAYPKIPDGRNCPLKKCIAFEKYDGTNLHFVWAPHRPPEDRPSMDSCCGEAGVFDWFGTRRDRFTYDSDGSKAFAKAHPELDDMLCDSLYDVEVTLRDKYYDIVKNEAIVFGEYWGPQSFAGQHVRHNYYNVTTGKCENPNPHQLTIIDIMIDGVILPPDDFIRDFGQCNIAQVVYRGKYTGQFVEDVRNGKYNVNEGVVCKGVVDGQLYMTKIKTNAYMKKLQSTFGNKWKDYWE